MFYHLITRKEIAHLPWRERSRLETEAMQRIKRQPKRMVVWLVASFITAVYGFAGLGQVLGFWSGIQFPPFPVALIPLGIAIWFDFRFTRRVIRQLLIEADLRPTSCFDCGYDLRGTKGETYPECGCQIAAPR